MLSRAAANLHAVILLYYTHSCQNFLSDLFGYRMRELSSAVGLNDVF
jgi:hypothetical protein